MEDLRHCCQLENLNLFYNLISSIPEDIFRYLKHLRVLQLGRNKLSGNGISGALLSCCHYLQTLALQENQITSCPTHLQSIVLGDYRVFRGGYRVRRGDIER